MATDDFTADELEAAGGLGGSPDPGYIEPTDPRTLAALEHWQDQKFGLIVHWGLYTSIGQGGSWSLHRERLGAFTDPPADFEGTDAEYHDWYYDQRRRFSGEDYDPEEWARVARAAGMKYLVFTTKHHDGFAMYDTAYSNLKSTAEDSPLGRDVFAETVEAFRAQGLETGVYFSKADWSHPGYWDRSLPVTDRFHNYDIQERPRPWQQFVEYTHAQIDELLTRYGRMNVLWLDAGWVRDPVEPIDIDRIAERARELQPDILVVDREVHGPHENYRTPEQTLPAEPLGHPWESCITFTRSWCSLRPEERTKPVGDAIANLVQIIARGGNYLLGVGPDATGAMSSHIKRGLEAIGVWVHTHAEAIYGTRAPATDPEIEGSEEGTWHATRGRSDLNLFWLPADARELDHDHPERLLPAGTVTVRSADLPEGELTATVLDGDVPVPLTRQGDTVRLELPGVPVSYAACVRIRGAVV